MSKYKLSDSSWKAQIRINGIYNANPAIKSIHTDIRSIVTHYSRAAKNRKYSGAWSGGGWIPGLLELDWILGQR